MSKGHTIPLLHLARFLLRRRLAVTVFTTPANRPFIANSLSDTAASIVDLPFPENVPGVPSGVESTDKFPSMSLFFSFATATKRIQPDFERSLASLPPVSFIVSDGFLWWTLESASKFGIPRCVFYGMSAYAHSVSRAAFGNRLIDGPEPDNELIAVTDFPWIKLTKNDFVPTPEEPELKNLASEFHMNAVISTANSFGLIVNSFYELERLFVDHWNRKTSIKAWCVGPLCLAAPISSAGQSAWIQWLDKKLEQGSSVLYVAFGSQYEVSQQQLEEIATGLEESKVNFLWVLRKIGSAELMNEIPEGFEERVKDRGMVVRDWVEQREILKHESVEGFLSHCGWNSVTESICAGVPILAWPSMADQPLNAKMVVEEIKVGLRLETCDGSLKGFVKREGLKKMVKELMEGEKGKEARKKAKEVAEMAKKAVEETGSSGHELDSLIDDICKQRHFEKGLETDIPDMPSSEPIIL